MQRIINPGLLANCAPRLSVPQPVAQISGPAASTVQLRVAPAANRPQIAPQAMQPKMPIGTAMRPAAPQVYRPQQAPIMSQTGGSSNHSRIGGHTLQPFTSGVVQAKKFCQICQKFGHAKKDCPTKKAVPTTTPRTTNPSTFGTSHSNYRSNGKPFGHGRNAAEGGHNSGKRGRLLAASAANSIANAEET
jgi:hypothetical protein